jgi:hypothetical protein
MRQRRGMRNVVSVRHRTRLRACANTWNGQEREDRWKVEAKVEVAVERWNGKQQVQTKTCDGFRNWKERRMLLPPQQVGASPAYQNRLLTVF